MSVVDKQKLRTVFLRKRKFLSDLSYQEKNERVFELFKQLQSELNLGVLHSFLPINKQREVDTWPIIKLCQAENKDIIISRSDLEKNDLTHYVFESQEQLSLNKWGIPEPTFGAEATVESLDAILVPLIVFDRNGHRIGYGKGYYDKFLKQCRPDCVKIGLSLTPPVDQIPYIDDFDIPLDYCISPNKIYKFK
ncbi:MAG: 5-formyltetrahydrofolate cyclo-ligase [Reichenbachiella sp.]